MASSAVGPSSCFYVAAGSAAAAGACAPSPLDRLACDGPHSAPAACTRAAQLCSKRRRRKAETRLAQQAPRPDSGSATRSHTTEASSFTSRCSLRASGSFSWCPEISPTRGRFSSNSGRSQACGHAQRYLLILSRAHVGGPSPLPSSSSSSSSQTPNPQPSAAAHSRPATCPRSLSAQGTGPGSPATQSGRRHEAVQAPRAVAAAQQQKQQEQQEEEEAEAEREEAPEAAKGESGQGKARQSGAVKTRRVVVTGMGVVSCLGHDPDEFYTALLNGTSGITPIEGFDVSDFPTRIAGEIKQFDYSGYVHPKMAKRMDKYMWYLLTAGKKALEHAGMSPAVRATFDTLKCGILIGSAMGGMQVFNDAIEALSVSYRRMNPFCIPFVTTNMGSAMLAMDLGWMGPNYSISTACATANYCILSAAQHIIRGEADVMLSGGSDAPILPIGLGGFVACKALSKRNDAPSAASRPWDSDRDGFVMGEGAGVLVLEELEHAKARGASIHAEFLGGSFNCDAYHMTDPHPEGKGVQMCIERALVDSGVEKEWVNYVNAHATSTKAGDLQEYKAIIKALGSNPELKLNATKSMIGHLLGAAGAVEAIATVQAIKTGWLHPTLNVENPDKELDPNVLVLGQKQPLNVKVALSNSFGFGGHNSSILFGPYHPDGIAAAVEEVSAQAS